MARLRYNGLSTTLGAPLTSSATSVTFAASLTHSGGTAVPTIAGTDYIPLTILTSAGAVSEIVYLTAYTSGATTGTIARAQEGTGAVSHASGDGVAHAPTVSDVGTRYSEIARVSGDISLTATTPTAIDSGTDLTIAAAAGDLIEVGLSGLCGNTAQYVAFDVYTRVAGANVNPFGPGIAAGFTPGGIQGWYAAAVAQDFPLGGSVTRVLASGDVSGGLVTLRLMYVKLTSTGRTLYANSNNPFKWWAINHGSI